MKEGGAVELENKEENNKIDPIVFLFTVGLIFKMPEIYFWLIEMKENKTL